MVQCLCCSTSLQKLDESLVGEIKAHLFFFRHKSLIALLFYLMHSGQQYNANSQERSLCLKATSLYFILLSVPGSSAFSIFHPVLFAKAMETFKLAIKLHLVKFFLIARSARLYLCTCALPTTPTDGIARIYSLNPMPRLGMELTSAPLDLFEGP